ncbi:CDP-diacylglycerol--glycerol-3-phosphate 3-phosphatidyltransferase [Companilactobacillus sp.]|jgi:CDP-diacylglycerol--glycerol-3-phosphate 3-phosphatidyltransferase|uniref:CDP-diacylglycerol--glycerol-3-phosphate 3-phosphatidyltransferase n=1 Tax=Companilactobacillus sp. TaxID=2767905 RepID=UPI0025BF0A7F|nr:CDP-diacylglycerol--glycerol-3-phosphate 3-phosphatidyltransferase [Companilactobacillus sp.]MCH4008812.1 CDP-diacylglycerol--glycerol-3-phosphate 3-phosphatidyltransferase [Companilactobacillus sp.]MCH4051009.1 CDP-diacylglycerol--glycerol-3-phosphate 3-phosphatidyltransferase [Companilactobacillus sp.]MCH4076755.1 CDP-diacylglycerol--glycerol-3-phosphate 3-phosphatidyltransferase [Companilactobacillus sp.]MCH4125330.1 CDP-diacylglycerol--glycerol-3-phosphate 3-phosphatidyltransferase [Comp
MEWNLPNKLTMFRIILIPVFIILLAFNFTSWGDIYVMDDLIPMNHVIATIVFIIASLTDLADGKIARKNKIVTNFGKFADPLADKMLVMTAFVFLVGLKMAPAWVIAIIVCRELAVTGLRMLLLEEGGSVMAAQMPGKIKTTTQMLAIIFLLMHNIFFSAINFPIGEIFLYICLFFTLYSGFDYFWQARDVFKK